MRTLSRIVVAVLAALGALHLVTLVISALENKTSSFLTYQELMSSDLVGKGWIPDGLPPSTHDVSESHDVSSGSGSASFRFDPRDTAATRKRCKLLAESPGGAKFLCPPFGGSSFVVVLGRSGRGSWELYSDAI